MIEIELSWPSRHLNPNARVHWRRLADEKQNARYAASWHCAHAGSSKWVDPGGKLEFALDFYPPDRRKRDDDGLIASMKAARDGIADRLGIDDNRFQTRSRIMDEVVKGGKVVVRIRALES